MQNKTDKIFFYNLLVGFILLFGLVNIEHYHFSFNYLSSEKLSDKIKFFRSLIPLFLLLHFFFNKFILKIKFKSNLIINFLFLYLLLQFFGLLFSDENPFYNVFYLALYFSSLIIFFQVSNLKIENIKMLKFLLIFVLMVLFLIFFSNNFYLYLTTNFSFYVEYPIIFRADLNPSLYDPSISNNLENNTIYQPMLGESPPRSSGISRIALILSIFFLVFLYVAKRYNIFLYLLLIYLNSSIFLTYSKINIFCLIFFSLLIIFFSFSNIKNKLFNILILLLLPICLTIYLTHAKTNKFFPFKNLKQNEIERKNFQEREILPRKDHFFTLTGRDIIWRDIINKTKNKWYLGNGPQADRYIVKQSASSSFFYAYSSGGLLSSLIFLFIYGNFVIKIIKILIKKKIKLVRNDPLLYSSILILMYVFMRSLFESSFAVFGLDLIIFLTSLTIFDRKLKTI